MLLLFETIGTNPQWWEIPDSLSTADDTPEGDAVSEWLNCVHLITRTGEQARKGVSGRRIYKAGGIFKTIMDFIGVIPKPITPLYYDFFSRKEKNFFKKKERKKKKIHKEFAMLYNTLKEYSEIVNLSPLGRKEMLMEVRQNEKKRVASVENEYYDYFGDVLGEININRKHLQRLQSHGFDF